MVQAKKSWKSTSGYQLRLEMRFGFFFLVKQSRSHNSNRQSTESNALEKKVPVACTECASPESSTSRQLDSCEYEQNKTNVYYAVRQFWKISFGYQEWLSLLKTWRRSCQFSYFRRQCVLDDAEVGFRFRASDSAVKGKVKGHLIYSAERTILRVYL